VSYVVESGASPARRARRRRAFITLAVVALMLFFAFWYAYSYYREGPRPAAAATPTCTTTTQPVLKPASVTVNVYNSTDRNGLAAKTAAEVAKRGFKVKAVANDPLDKGVTGTAEVRYGKAGKAHAKLVLALVKGAKAVQDDRKDVSVDLVLGSKFTALVKPAKASNAAQTSKATPTGKATASATTGAGKDC
jgi:hypothetical protein